MYPAYLFHVLNDSRAPTNQAECFTDQLAAIKTLWQACAQTPTSIP